MYVYVVQDRETMELITVTSNREKAMNYLGNGYVITGCEIED